MQIVNYKIDKYSWLYYFCSIACYNEYVGKIYIY